MNEIDDIADLSGTNSSTATFVYTDVVNGGNAKTAAASPQPGEGGSFNAANAAGNGLSVGAANAIPLIVDTDRLRIAMLDAIEALEAKLDSIINISPVNCFSNTL